MATYNSTEAAQIAGVPYPTLMRWVEQGLIRPQSWPGKQRGEVEWSDKNVREASILGALRKCGFSMQKLRDILAYLRRLGHNPFSTGRFLVCMNRMGQPESLVKICDDGEAFELMRDGRGQMLLPLWTSAGGGNE